MTIIRQETTSDLAAIHSVNKQAFNNRESEPGLVKAICNSEENIKEFSLVAEENGQIVGHILFNRIYNETKNRQVSVLALAQTAVLPEYQKQSIGSRVVRYGLDECKRLGYTIIIVHGHRAYYPRFGFSTASAKSLLCPFGDRGDAWMALDLVPDALHPICGKVVYPPSFNGD